MTRKYSIMLTDAESNIILGPIILEFPDLWTATAEVMAAYGQYRGADGLTIALAEEDET